MNTRIFSVYARPIGKSSFFEIFFVIFAGFQDKTIGRTFFMSLMRPIDLTSLCGLKFIVGDINLWKGGVIASSEYRCTKEM